MTSVPPMAVEQPPIFHVEAERTPLQEAVASELGEGLASSGFLVLPSQMEGFVQTGEPKESVEVVNFGTGKKPCPTPVTVRTVPGALVARDAAPMVCPCCGGAMERHGEVAVTLWHLPTGMDRTRVVVARQRWACASGHTRIDDVPFKAEGHRVTVPLLNYVRDLLSLGQTLKSVSLMTGLHKNVVKEIDRARLEGLYTEVGEDGGRRLRRPGDQARYLGIDEFKLHDGHRYATVVVDLETGHVLWLAHGKRKQVVYDFCDFVGDEWMSRVVAVACDMNASYERAFLERHPHLAVVYDHFHLVKNFNEKVISEVRKDEQRRLREEGDEDAAKSLKGSKYILMTRADTRLGKDRDARAGKVVSRGNELFGKDEARQRGGNRERYEDLIAQNELLSTCDIVKEALAKAYAYRQEKRMRDCMEGIVEVCRGTGNEHFEWFANLVEGHMDGIVAHARHRISSGKVEGTNNTIKSLRRAGYGYPDDEYFFLKIFDASRRYSPGRESVAA